MNPISDGSFIIVFASDAYRPHGMRHTFTMFALAAGVDFQTIILLMNHSSQHVSFNYVTRSNLIGPICDVVERISDSMLEHRD